nr:MAG TPA: hypothetical protein [Caudoviricetes sp.]
MLHSYDRTFLNFLFLFEIVVDYPTFISFSIKLKYFLYIRILSYLYILIR